MLSLLWLVPALPLAGFSVLAAGAGRLTRPQAALVGVGAVGLSALGALLVAASFLVHPPPGHAFVQQLWTWIDIDGFAPRIALRLDALSLLMMAVITFVAFLIHLYSSEFMIEEEGYGRFFAYMNLFVAMMLILVLADNLLLLYLGWEGVGLCSYLLIGFWYKDPANGAAARKAFIVTRIGDAAMAVGLFLVFTELGTMDIQEMMRRAGLSWTPGSAMPVAAAALLLGGALGKSAQIPLQTWLPDAMAGPTPVSALIHAATMVTAGVYLVARTHALYTLAPPVQHAVAVIGALTLLVAGASAMVQRDIKRVLAYSTISQIGYMFLALGVGAYTAAIFHFMTHAFFKALLFLAAGAVIRALHHEHDIFRMGGLRKELPLAFWTFLAAGASLSGFPLVTAGFYSKDEILRHAWSSPSGGPWLFAAGWTGAVITGIYIFRLIFQVFFGAPKGPADRRPSVRIELPLAVLAVLSVGAGFVEIPGTLGGSARLTGFLGTALPVPAEPEGVAGASVIPQLLAIAASLLGIGVAYLLFLRRPGVIDRLARTSMGEAVHRLWLSGWGFDRLYDRLIVRPVVRAAAVNRDDFIDSFYDGVALFNRMLHRVLVRTQTGNVRWYAAAIAAGAAGLVAIVLFL
ncbi:MAG: NADH-quinone oxidoreductase subunit L [Deltaproteobacteria bacterium]|nr:NADH-quinone oxidoreductase subunit L [Deltaproteobacteria bacterium]